MGGCVGLRWGHGGCPAPVRRASDGLLAIIPSSGPASLLHAGEIQPGEWHHALPHGSMTTSST